MINNRILFATALLLHAAVVMGTNNPKKNTKTVWSLMPAYTQVMENQNERGATSEVYDGKWQGEGKNILPKVKQLQPVKEWQSGEGTDYLLTETNKITKGKYPNPVRIWEGEPYPIGNGRIAASVFNGSGRDRFALADMSFWSGGQNKGVVNSKGDKSYNGEDGPEATAEQFGGQQPIGDLIVDFHAPAEKGTFIREIRLDEGTVYSACRRNGITVQTTAFCSYPDQVMVVHYKADKSKSLNCRLSFATQRPEDSALSTAQELILNCRLKNGMEEQTKVQVLHSDGEVIAHTDYMELKNITDFTLLVIQETNYAMDYTHAFRGKRAAERVDERVNALQGKSYRELYERHRADYSSLFNRVAFNICTDQEKFSTVPTPERLAAYRQNPNDRGLEETLFNFSRYLMICTSRPGALPAGLQGIWNGMIHAPWGNDYHSNINMQMVYWLPEVGNLSECHLPLIDYLYAMREPNKEATREYLKAINDSKANDSDGWIVYTSHNPFGGHGWQVNLPGSAWYGLHIWEHFAFTEDTVYLKKKAYPMLKELSEYWKAHLKRLGQGGAGFMSNYKPVDISQYPELKNVKEGTLVVPTGWSPEHGPRGEDGVTHDQQIVKELFLNTMKAARIVGENPQWIAELEQIVNNMYTPQIGRKGNLMEWMIDRDPETDHRHTSHLFGVYPGSTISVEHTPRLAEAAKKSLLFRKNSGDSHRSWAWVWRSCLWSRLAEGERAHEMLEKLITYNMLDNLFTTHHIPLQIDGNYGLGAAMIEMLVQSDGQTIRLLPALCKKWPDGSVKGIKARGNITVNMKWEKGKVTSWQLLSPSPKKIKLFVNNAYKQVETQKLAN